MILYTPLDIPCSAPDVTKIVDWFQKNKYPDDELKHYAGDWHDYAPVASRLDITDWTDWKPGVFDWVNNRTYNPDRGLFFNPSFEIEFPDLVESLKQLPFKQFGGILAVRQVADIENHFDENVPKEGIEPLRYSIYLTDPIYNTFYMDYKGTKYNPTFNDQYRCFAFNNFEAEHGATPPIGEKIILFITGVLDRDKHAELIYRSIAKFKEAIVI
jgi:hypothetical protein